MSKPTPQEYVPFYAGYINKIGDADILTLLRNQIDEAQQLAALITADKEDYAYAPGKWTVKQVWGHIIDTERVMAYRLLRFARNDQKELQGFEQDDYVDNARSQQRTLSSLLQEFNLLRQANLFLFESLNEAEKARTGTANGNPVTVNALLYIIAGHAANHFDILKERYLGTTV